jgi:choline dehydrogenase
VPVLGSKGISMEPQPRRVRRQGSRRAWEYIIVGGGTAGCVLANRLSDDPSVTVLVLEAGPMDHSIYLRLPVGRLFLDDRFEWSFPAESDSSRYGKCEIWNAGKVIGGSGSINGMLWTRGDRRDFDEWAELGAKGWDFESVLPYFRRSEAFAGTTSELRGTDGPMQISPYRLKHQLVEHFVNAARAAGFEDGGDYNAKTRVSHEAVAYGQTTQKRGLRWGPAQGYLRPVRTRPNVVVKTSVQVRRVLFEGDRARAVEYIDGGHIHTVEVRREIVLSAGALSSPKILMLSGIGDADALKRYGIAPVVDLPGVGENLRNHIGLAMMHEVRPRTLNREFTPWGLAKHGADFLIRGGGAATVAPGMAILYGSFDGARTDFSATFAPFAFEQGGKGGKRMRPSSLNAVQTRAALLHPFAHGTVTLRSSEATDRPIIHFAACADKSDRDRLVEVCHKIRRVFDSDAMGNAVIREVVPGKEIQTDGHWDEVCKRLTHVSKHYCGTCRIGSDDRAVVDPDLCVRGVTGLRVADSSVMPTIVSGGTYAATIMIGEHAADLIRRK